MLRSCTVETFMEVGFESNQSRYRGLGEVEEDCGGDCREDLRVAPFIVDGNFVSIFLNSHILQLAMLIFSKIIYGLHDPQLCLLHLHYCELYKPQHINF